MIVPDSPTHLIGEFLPQSFALLASRQAPPPAAAGAAKPSPHAAAKEPVSARKPPAPVGIGVRVVGAGEWTLRVVGERLLVEPCITDDVALQVSLAESDFIPLVVAPLRRALEAKAAAESGGPAPGGLAGSLWSRLGRWDEETVELLRRQTAGILLRIQDGELRRCVALTPSLQPYSLESAQCTIDCALSDLQELQEKRGSPLDLFYAGQIRISGDAQIALAMAGLFL